MSVVWEAGSKGGFCVFPSQDVWIVSVLGGCIGLVTVGLLPVCGPLAHRVYSPESCISGYSRVVHLWLQQA